MSPNVNEKTFLIFRCITLRNILHFKLETINGRNIRTMVIKLHLTQETLRLKISILFVKLV